MQLFYSQHIEGSKIYLSDQEAQHCAKVLRNKVGDVINVLDGQGTRYRGVISSSKKSEVIISDSTIVEQQTSRPTLPTLTVGLLKNNTRLEWMIEKAVEIGVARITLVNCKRSERSKVNLVRLAKIMLSAMKQSKRLYLPEIQGVVSFDYCLRDMSSYQMYIAHYRAGQKTLYRQQLSDEKSQGILIGPEGDFTDQEVASAVDSGCIPINLGSARLRTETAAVVSLVALNNKIQHQDIKEVL